MDGKNLPETLQSLFGAEADRLAKQCKCVLRERKLKGSTIAQILIFGLLQNPRATSSQLAQAAVLAGQPVSPQAIDQRMEDPTTATFLLALLQAAIGKIVALATTVSERLQRFSAVELLDSTTIALDASLESIWPGCGSKSPQGSKAALKVQVRFDLLRGCLLMELMPGRASDQTTTLQTADLKAGALHVRDLGYFDLGVMQTIAAAKAYFLSRLMNGTLVYDIQGQRIDLVALLHASDTDLDVEVRVGSCHQVPMRLLARRLPKKIAELRRRKLRAKAKRKGYTPSDEALELRGWTIMITNVPTERLNLDEAIALSRQRWQIELLFKLWKSQGGLGHSNRKKAQTVLTETYAKLLAMLVQHWVLWLAMGKNAARSLVKGSSVVRNFAWQMLDDLKSLVRLYTLFDLIKRILQTGAKIQKRGKKPAAFQVLEDPITYGYKPA